MTKRCRTASLIGAVVVTCLLTGDLTVKPLVARHSTDYSLVSMVKSAVPLSGKTVRYLGYRFLVPRSWPVVDDTRSPKACVRFDRHAVYLGPVSGDESCPSRLLGTTESILIQPGPAMRASKSTENPVARQVTVRAPGLLVTASYDSHPIVIYQILASAGLPPPTFSATPPSPAPDLLGHVLASSSARRQPAPPPLPATIASYSGLGFDTCAAPSRRDMRVWLHRSWYRAVGIYIGGADRTCAQPNLTSDWVRAEAAAGWRFIPLYAGPQAKFGELVAPGRQGQAAARDAVAQARRLGFGPQTPLYYDMEGFPPIWNSPALRFLSAWSAALRRLGYTSGVYSSGDSGIVDLARQYFKRTYAMPDVIYDAVWNGEHSTADKRLHHLWWHKRIHQFTGQRTQAYGGVTLDVNRDFFDMQQGAAYVSTFTSQPTSAVNLPDGSTMVFYRAPDRQLWQDRRPAGANWTRPTPAGVRAWSTPSVVWTGSVVAVFYRGAAGRLGVLSYHQNGRLAGRGVLRKMGAMGLGPYVVSQPGGVIDVFWRGSADDQLWHGQFTPGTGWSAPQRLGGGLRSAPSPVTSGPGCTSVFWRGPGNSLWMTSRGLRGTWSKAGRLGLRPVDGSPQATAQSTGGIEVYWSGSPSPDLREGFYSVRTGWGGPRDLGGQLRSMPLPVTAAGLVAVLWLGPGHRIYFIEHRPVSNWNAPGWTRPASAPVSWAESAPFAAVGGAGRTVRVFWRGWRDSLWTATLTGAAWSRPVNL